MIEAARHVFEFFFYTSDKNFVSLLSILRETEPLYEFLSISAPYLHVFLKITALGIPIFVTFLLRSKFLRFFIGVTIFVSAIHIKTVLNCLLSNGPPSCSSEDFEGTIDFMMKIVGVLYVSIMLFLTSLTREVIKTPLQRMLRRIKSYLRGSK